LGVRESMFLGRARGENGWKRTYLLCVFGELKQSGVGERAPASVPPASPMPCPPSAREGAMGERVLAKSKKGDKEATCELFDWDMIRDGEGLL
jgi:hypothetical protein